jgi:hypothetical protein
MAPWITPSNRASARKRVSSEQFPAVATSWIASFALRSAARHEVFLIALILRLGEMDNKPRPGGIQATGRRAPFRAPED